jgi:twitching motility protein PilT
VNEPSFDFATPLRHLLAEDGSDLHLKVGNRPLIRVDGVLRDVDENAARLEPHETEEALHQLIPDSRIAEFEERHELDFAYAVPGLARFRVNAFKQRGSISLVLRVVPSRVPTIEELGLPETVRQLADLDRGIVLVTGSTGSGKSTTLAAMIGHINRTYRKHVITIEDPIEYMYHDERASIDQREVGLDTDSFRTALRHVLRQDPDVIPVGEMRGRETARAALSAAETAHLVLSTLHTVDAPETINRIIELFDVGERQQVRAMLAGTTRGIISQRLVRTADGEGRTAICEVLTMTGRVHDMIADPDETGGLVDVISEGEFYGMQTFDQALYGAVTDGTVTMRDALRAASRPHDLELLVAAGGHTSTHIDDLDRYAPSPPA